MQSSHGRYNYGKKTRRGLAVIAAALMISTGWCSAGYTAPQEDKQPTVVVSQYSFSGQSPVSGSELTDLLSGSVGKPATLQDLEQNADIITRYLRSKGYFVAFAYIPAQDFAGGNIYIAIEPGRYDQVLINNQTKIHEDAIRRELGGVAPGALVEKKSLERAVWLIGDLAGAEAKTSLQAGSQPGTTTLTINVTPEGKKTWGYVGVDNGGYRHTGRTQYTAMVNQANPFREGDLLTVSGLYTGEGQSAGSISYTAPVLDQGSRIGISYARSRYLLGGPYAGWDMTGTADVLSLSYQKNLQRSRNANWYAQLRFDTKELSDKAFFGLLDNHKKAHNWVIGLSGETLDNWQGGGANTYSLTYTAGRLSLHDPLFQALDKAGLQTEGSFGKYNLVLTRLQQLRERLALYLTYSYQGADKNLDPSEKMVLGGPFAVRAYPVGEASGDQGWLGMAELRWNLPNKEGAKDVWQLITFVDAGAVSLDKNPIIGSGDNRRSLSGMGVGVNWSRESNWAARFHYAWKLSSDEAQSDTDKSGRFWLQVYRFF